MNIIIVGCDLLGSILANNLSDAGHNVSVIDRESERLNVLGSGYNGVKIKGIEYDNEILMKAGIHDTDILLAVTTDENINITVSLIAKEMYKVPRVIARIMNPNRKYIYENLNIETINPIQLEVDILEAKLALKRETSLFDLSGEYEIIGVTVKHAKQITVQEIEKEFDCIISAIDKGNAILLPLKSEFIKQGERIICTIRKKDRERLVSVL
ncbi:MAG TPA: TrkA family potassium uptake protein [Bacillota bacterium]|nr:TrkA family potassium uptake protein [Bacillota bacterium]